MARETVEFEINTSIQTVSFDTPMNFEEEKQVLGLTNLEIF